METMRLRGPSFGSQTRTLLFLYLLFLFIFHVVNQLCIIFNAPVDIPGLYKDSSYYLGYLIAKYILIIASVLIIFRAYSQLDFDLDSFGLNPSTFPKSLFVALQVFLVFPGSLLFLHLVQVVFPSWLTSFSILAISQAPSVSLYPLWFSAEVLAGMIFLPIIEELVFRGFLFKALRKSMPLFPTVFITALLFTLYHINPFAVENATFFLGLLPIFVGGMVYGYLRGLMNSLWAPLLYHIFWNMGYYILYYWRWSA